MKMSRINWIHIVLAIVLALVALFFIRLHNASGATLSGASAGHRLADAWCKDCHAIDAAASGATRGPPDFIDIANRASTTALSLKVFLQTSHPSMPNLILKPAETDDLVDYILSLKRN
jgi:mono/diheme cytochrome c family protein